jgi:hypothetical protein
MPFTPSPMKNLEFLGRKFTTSRLFTNKWSPALEKEFLTYNPPSELSNGARFRLIAINGVLFAVLKSRA